MAQGSKLSADELAHYARHIVLSDLGGAGQQKLKQARVLVIGAGGLGAPLLAYLAAAGVGTLGIADDDIVAKSNLQRQIIHTQSRIGTRKVESAAAYLRDLNPHVNVVAHNMRVDGQNLPELLADYDLVADGCDNFATRCAVADACELAKLPLISAAVQQYDGSLTVLKPYETGEDGKLNPTYRCLYPHAPANVQSCAEAGIIGALTGVMGSLQAMEVIKEITGIGHTLVGKVLLYDARDVRFSTLSYKRRADLR